jgi:hypothetical protein
MNHEYGRPGSAFRIFDISVARRYDGAARADPFILALDIDVIWGRNENRRYDQRSSDRK